MLFSERSQSLLKQAGLEASQLGHAEIEPEDMLLALVNETDGIGARVLTDLGADLGTIKSKLKAQTKREEEESDSQPELGRAEQESGPAGPDGRIIALQFASQYGAPSHGICARGRRTCVRGLEGKRHRDRGGPRRRDRVISGGGRVGGVAR